MLLGCALRASIQLRLEQRPCAAALRYVCTEAVLYTLPFMLILTFIVVTSASSRIFKAHSSTQPHYQGLVVLPSSPLTPPTYPLDTPKPRPASPCRT